MMEILIAKVKNKPEVQDIVKRSFIGAFFDDCGIGTETEEDHLQLLEHFLIVCQENQVRVKLSKCDFLQEQIDYLGFKIGWGTWSPSPSKVKALLDPEGNQFGKFENFYGCIEILHETHPKFHRLKCNPA